MFLSLASIFDTRWQCIFSRHCFILLFASLAINAYRNIWPLATYTKVPADIHDGAFLWIKIALLLIGAILIPLFSPRKYTPLNPEVLVPGLLVF